MRREANRRLVSARRTWWRRGLRGLNVALLFSLSACADQQGGGSEGESSDKFGSRPAPRAQSPYSQDFSLETETGMRIFESARSWIEEQVDSKEVYAQPRMCAHNVSYVLEDAGLRGYSSYLVPEMVAAASIRGGEVIRFPREKAGFIKALNARDGGRLPIGTLLNGCLYEDCGGEGGDGHIAILGETDEEGVVWAYHNNWYRPENEGGAWRDHMVSKYYHDELGLRRQWMATPWIRIKRGEGGEIIDVEGLLPALDDLDPFVGFYITATILPEILEELGDEGAKAFTCPAGRAPDLQLGFCVDEGAVGETGGSGNAYGPFTQAMVERCQEAGYGQACSRRLKIPVEGGEIEAERWSVGIVWSLRGSGLCPTGATIDTTLERCVERRTIIDLDNLEMPEREEDFVLGPFHRDMVQGCQTLNAGPICASTQWPLWLYEEVNKD